MIVMPIGDEAELERTPFVNITLIGINAVVFFFVNAMSNDAEIARVFNQYGLIPARLEWYQFITCMFLHGDFMHIVGNMIFLFIFGDNVEERLGHLGYVFFYLVSGIGASAFYVFLTGNSMIPCVGASGAIFGVVAAFAILSPHVRVRMLWWWWIRGGTFLISAKFLVAFWVVEQLVYYYVTAGFGGGIAYAAHLGGALFGALVAIGVRIWGKPPPAEVGWGAEAFDRDVAGSAWMPPPPDIAPLRRREPAPAASGVLAASPTFEDHPRRRSGSPTHADRSSMSDSDAVLDAIDANEVEAAIAIYSRHATRSNEALDAPAQAAIAAAFFERAEFVDALNAYRSYLRTHPVGPDSASAKFRAGVILSRRMKQRPEGKKLLLQAVMEHHDPAVVELARGEIDRIRDEGY